MSLYFSYGLKNIVPDIDQGHDWTQTPRGNSGGRSGTQVSPLAFITPHYSSSTAVYQGQFQGNASASPLIMSTEEVFVLCWKNIASSFQVAESQNSLQHPETDVTHIFKVMTESWMICHIVWFKAGLRILVKSTSQKQCPKSITTRICSEVPYFFWTWLFWVLVHNSPNTEWYTRFYCFQKTEHLTFNLSTVAFMGLPFFF